VTAAAYLEYLVEDPDTAIIGGFIETIREPERFAAALDRAAALDKPVVLLKVGRTARSRYAITTHTASDAGNPEAISDMLRAHRVIEVDDLVELTETLAALQSPRRPRGRRIAIVMSSGGVAELILDVAAATGLQIPPLSPTQKAELEAGCGFITGDGNPCDAWGSGTFAANLPQALKMFDASPGHDIIVFARDTAAVQRHQQDEAVEVAGQHDVAAAAQHQPAQSRRPRVAHGGQQLRLVLDAVQQARADIEAERVVLAQGIVGEERTRVGLVGHRSVKHVSNRPRQ